MRAVLFNNYVNGINGSVLDVLDYYITMYKFNKSIKMIFINFTKEFQKIIFNLIDDRYELNGLDIKKNIIGIKRRDLVFHEFDRLLIFDYGTIRAVKGLVRLKNENSRLVIISELYTDEDQYTINKSLYPEGCVQYYGEMPFVYKDNDYIIKHLLKNLKTIKQVNSGIFVNSPRNNDYSFLKEIELPDKPLIYKTDSHKDNLFELFDTYLYYHANTYFDPRPRLFAECYYYGKDII